MKDIRSAGVLLHITSLPGKFGIGDLGPAAYQFADFLLETGQKIWQILPLGSTETGNPYSGTSAFAANPMLLSPEKLVQQGLLEADYLSDLPHFNEDKFDYKEVSDFKNKLLRHSFKNFRKNATEEQKKEFDTFCQLNSFWLNDFAVYMTIKENYRNKSWIDWPAEFAFHDPGILEKFRADSETETRYYKYLQYLFFFQWYQLKAYVNKLGIKIIGDMPVYVNYESADVWAHPELFLLDEKRRPVAVSGAPPDQFSEKGQLWDNPLYDWDKLKETNFNWWIKRLKKTLTTVDVVRIDHFRGLEAYWSIPAGSEDACKGKWVTAPGDDFLTAAVKELGTLNVIAEDLGHITPEVIELRDKFKLPGMKVLHFAFQEGPGSPYLPHNYEKNFIAYTGTHDNDTTVSWFNGLPAENREYLLDYLYSDGSNIHWELIRLAHSSVADTAIIPLQDIMGCGGEARMNDPTGTVKENFKWRFRDEMLTREMKDELKLITKTYGR
jgi:4-alpha-glucanotransferase